MAKHILIALCAAGCAMAGCKSRPPPDERVTPEQYGSGPETQATPQPGPNPVVPARTERERRTAEVDDLETVEGIGLDGTARLVDDGSGVKVVLDVAEAPPGLKAVHVHEKGDCSNVAGASMGKHFAPDVMRHGLPTDPPSARHLGDLGNMTIGKDGKGHLEISVARANLKPGDALSFLGKALVIHESDDKGGGHQPSGGAGKPMACGVIEAE